MIGAIAMLVPMEAGPFTIVLLMCRLSLNTAFSMVFISQNELFQGEYLMLMYSIVNISSRFATIFSPIVAEVENKLIPNMVSVMMCATGMVCSSMLRFKRKIVLG